MLLTPEIEAFLADHAHDDLTTLALNAKKFPHIPISFAINQLQGRKTAAKKLSIWANTQGIVYPHRLAMEQCSSEATAAFKAQWIQGFLGNVACFADVSGGLGVDCYFFSKYATKGYYVEPQEELCALAQHNFERLGASSIHVQCQEAEKALMQLENCDFIYLDPARREGEKKLVLLDQCMPDVVALQESLLQKAPYILIKTSPLLEINSALQQLPTIQKIAVVAVDGECKELLLLLGREKKPLCSVMAVNLGRQGEQRFEGSVEEERAGQATFSEPLKYLYEPHAALMKSGLFKSLSQALNMPKLHSHTHLYTSQELHPHFPGRSFEVIESHPFQSKLFKKKGLLPAKANVAVRNFPLTAEELQKKAGIQTGGDIYLFGTTTMQAGATILVCKKAIPA